MADQRSVMKEFRLLEQKRQAGGLSPQEEARLAQLRDLVGPETGVGLAKPGFDVNAAAAKLRESLLPAGLRNRPPPMPEAAAEPPPEAAPEPEPAAAGLEAEWNAAPFAPLTETPGLSADALFDPGTLGEEPAAWDPNAQPHDAGAQAWDPNAQPYDPNQPYDAGAQAWDPNAQPYDPNAPAYDPNTQPYDPNSPAYDPNAQPYDAGAQEWDPNAAAQWDAAVQPAMDPTLAAPWSEQVASADAAPAEWDAGAVAAAGEPAAEAAAWDSSAIPPEPSAEGEAAWEVVPGPEVPPPAEALGEPPGIDAPEFGAEEPGLAEAAPIEPDYAAPGSPEPEFAEPGAEALGIPEPEFGAPEIEPHAEPEPVAEELLPFDAAAASAIGPDAAPEGWGPEASLAEAAGFAVETDGYGHLSGNEPVAQTDALPAEEAQGLLAPLGDGQELTSEDDAFAQGFHLESNGSFGKTGTSAEPAWSATAPSTESESWESAPALDLGAMSPASDVPPLELGPGAATLAPPPPAKVVAPPPDLDALDEIEVEEIPIVEGEDFLEELPPAPAPAKAPPPLSVVAAMPPAPPSPARAAAVAAAAAPGSAVPAAVRVEGLHKVVVHTLEGLVKRGSISDARLDAPTLPLAQQAGAPPEELPTAKVKAIFFMLSPGEPAPAPAGKKVRVTFTDGRQIAGFSPDYTEAGAGFYMIPADTRTNTGRIWVYRSAVKSVSVT